ncbi:hypothetical protein KR222_004415 [Zaprionus bogoriensis]|nr:hypothetical protein KR222_004415 [Zaprionus bogoriensis]
MASRTSYFNSYEPKLRNPSVTFDSTTLQVQQIENRMRRLAQQYRILKRSANELRSLKHGRTSNESRLNAQQDYRLPPRNARLYAKRLSQLLQDFRRTRRE